MTDTPMPTPIRLLLVDDHPLVRDGLRLRLDAITEFQVVGEAGDAAEALALLACISPHLILTDISMKGGSGIALTQAIRQRYPAIRILVLSMHNNREYVTQALAAGAHGYVLKDSPATQIIEAIYAIASGRTFFDRELAERQPPAARHAIAEKLTPREYEILRLLVTHAGKVLTHRFILREVWGGDVDVQYLRSYVRALRQKIEADPERPAHILTEQGVGYRLQG